MRSKVYAIGALLILALAAVALTACGGESEETEAGSKKLGTGTR